MGERLFVGSGLSEILRWATSGRTVVLAYHNIVPKGAPPVGDRALHLPVDTLDGQLRELARTHEIVPIDQLWSPASGTGRPLAAITFDDAYSGAVTLGIEQLVRLGLPGTIFVSPGLLGREMFWWDLLGDSSERLAQERSRVLRELSGDGRLVREQYDLQEREAFPEYALTATVPELQEAAQNPGISLGAHGWFHRNLDTLPEGEVRSELQRSLSWLGETVPEAMIPWITYPYGLAAPRVQTIAREVGFEGGFLCGGGGFERTRGKSDRFDLPRVNIPSSLSMDGFRIRATGANLV